jgi:hypothetical protein
LNCLRCAMVLVAGTAAVKGGMALADGEIGVKVLEAMFVPALASIFLFLVKSWYTSPSG